MDTTEQTRRGKDITESDVMKGNQSIYPVERYVTIGGNEGFRIGGHKKHCCYDDETESSIKKSNVYNCCWCGLGFFIIV